MFSCAMFESRCATWNKKPRHTALLEIAKTLETVALVQLRADSDTYFVTTIDAAMAYRVSDWAKKTKLPFRLIAGPKR
jgi:hypothetical protein